MIAFRSFALDIIDAIAVEDIEAALAAVSPDRVLHEPGKSLRKRWIELPYRSARLGLELSQRSRRASSRPHHTSGSR
jgi:hypothetical protein